MLYILKKDCPDHIQADIDRLIGTDEWDNIPEVPSPAQVDILRKQYFDKLQKSPIREALIAEQHGLCAYCMDRLESKKGSNTIEHLVPLSKSKAKSMDYRNWLSVCLGGQNIEPEQGEDRVVCCDAKKGHCTPLLSPFNKSQMDRIAYHEDGTIFYDAPSGKEQRIITREINYTFGLNGKVDQKTGHSRKDTTTGIVKQRKDAYIAMFEELERMEHQGDLSPEVIHKFQQALLSDPLWEPFLGVKLYVLDLFLKHTEK